MNFEGKLPQENNKVERVGEDRAKRLREAERYETEPVSISEEDKKLLDETFEEGRKHLDENYRAGFGIFPSANPDSNYFNQMWARDSAHAGGNYFARENPDAAIDSLGTLLKHQREDGSIPSRVEREYQAVKFTPGLRKFSKPIFNFFEGTLKGRTERPVHEGMDFAGGEDTIPATLIAAGELFINSEKGRTFVKEHFPELKKAVEFFGTTKVDAEDGLAVMTRSNPDWADTVARKGKLGAINVWWARGLRLMEYMARESGDTEVADAYRDEFEKVKNSIMEKLYDKDGAFFRAEVEDDRLDTAASVFGALYFLSPEEAVRVEQALKQRVEHGSGLQNFDPPYPQKDIFWAHRLMGQWLYHNKFVWPWVTLQNIQVKIKIAKEHRDAATREQYQREAVEDLIKIAKLFKTAGGSYEVFEPDEPRRGETKFYHPPQNFMGSMAAYQGAYAQLKALGWV